MLLAPNFGLLVMRLEGLVAITRVALVARISNTSMVAFAPRKRGFLHILIMV